MSNLRLDQTVTLSIEAIDAGGNPAPVVFDAAPTWTNSNPAAATNVVAADGLTNVLTPVPGALGLATTVTVAASIGGMAFTATADYTITAAPIVITSIRIVETFSPA